ncbi:hypothetical protein ABEF92_006032 [Exophiala dermatitidis]|uniref:Trafficking protein particle complex II-specific subunit 65 IgD3 domain-containing protein n=1 Tax=Exophiala dermatitidis (strain ATCC 34100 / CBS 525.76 / NIH/UT8656) TaxID=858893 RepID=H6BXI6_EXODN|nr:uncharacterized protein HMPREF1120_04322 [Exophiala dermatitidis NIH/UT8656]EHY56233.1 hypothetical protein HMPREF1120_04322 [Exophiala dermatitidis NIH/UT8656]
MDSEFLKASLLDVLIPADTVTESSALLERSVGVSKDFGRLLAIEERDILFIDERLKTFVVLRVPACAEATLKSYLSRLSCRLDVWAIDDSSGRGPDVQTPVPKELVFSIDGIQKNEPMVLATQSDENAESLTMVWEVEVIINRPKLRGAQTSVVFIPSAAVAAVHEAQDVQNADMLPFQPLDSNVLEPMRLIPNLERAPPYLPASRLERVMPIAPSTKPRFHIPQVPSRRHRIVPAVIARIHYSKSSSLSTSVINLALLDIEIIPFIAVEATIEHVELSLRHGRVESLTSSLLPMTCRSGDCITFIYRLYHDADASMSVGGGVASTNIDDLSVEMRVDINLSSHCKSVVIMDWTTHVDFTQALNPAFGPPSQPIQRANRPPGLPVNGRKLSSAMMPSTAALPSRIHDIGVRNGLSIAFTAADGPVQVGHAFSWKILVMNNSPETAKIAIIPLPRIHRQASPAQFFARRHAPKSSTASFHPSERRHTKLGEDEDIAQAIVDENVVYAMHHSSVIPPETDLMALTVELRIGPLGPGQCHESEIVMVAFQAGRLRVDAIRVVDLLQEVEQETLPSSVVDIRDLPDVVVELPNP